MAASFEPDRVRPDADLSERMSTLARRDTKPEVALRRELHRRGLRFRLQLPVPGNRRRTVDIAFTKAKLAVFVDGCFWHGCPLHHNKPRTNSEWWAWKIDRNTRRDRDTDNLLASAGWVALRVWEHETPQDAADRIELIWRQVTRPSPQK